MKIELKAVQYSAFASHETHCFNAKIYIDGKAFAEVNNDGRGGCDHVYPLNACKDRIKWRERLDAIEAHLAKTDIVTTIKNADGTFWTYPNNLESECGELMNQYHQKNEVKKILRRVSYLKADGKLYQLQAKYKPTPATIGSVKACGWFTDDCTMISGRTPDDAHKVLTDAGFFK